MLKVMVIGIDIEEGDTWHIVFDDVDGTPAAIADRGEWQYRNDNSLGVDYVGWDMCAWAQYVVVGLRRYVRKDTNMWEEV